MKIFRYITGPIMVNTYLVYDENGTGFIVDPGDYSRQLADKITTDRLDIQYILITHGHADHIGGVEAFQKMLPDVKVAACAAEHDLLSSPEHNSSPEFYGRDITVQPNLWVSEGDSLKIGSIELTFLETPGHSPGGMAIVMDGYVFSGDTLFQGSVGRTDFYGCSFPALIHSIRTKLFALPDDTVVLPGHMEKTTIRFEKENNPFVR